ncbi:TolC family protein [Brevundimonas aurantiaca]|jgi:cobalt-zinc-cadmium efflux system outer membrane protein|uniref:TolC family protein n=1 Tax=Brevundimonas aurantiaca TaxID=74316 RepID=UPI001600669F|nr:TolC family protein [Pseudomonas sp. FW305-3-2-15-E-TSA4]
MPAKSRRPRLAVGLTATALAAALSAPAWADPAPAYADLLSRLGQTPSAAEAAALIDAAEARVRQSRVRPNPTAGLELENAFGSGPFSGIDNAETTLSLSQNLELWGRRGARVSVAEAEAATVGLRSRLALIDLAGRLALSYAEAETAERRADLAQEALDLNLADARAALKLVEEGREPLLRGIQGEAESAAARAAFDEASAERDAAFARLTVLAQLPTPVTSVPATLLDEAPARAPSATDPLTVQVAEAEREAAERRIGVERIRARPDVTASVGVRRYEAEDATALTFGLSLPLPLFDRNRGNIDAAQADFRAADARVASARQDARADRLAAVARLDASASRVSAADAGVTAAEEAYRLSRIGFEAGRISQLELRATRAALISARNAALDARLARVRAEIDLARLEGRAPFGDAR